MLGLSISGALISIYGVNEALTSIFAFSIALYKSPFYGPIIAK